MVAAAVLVATLDLIVKAPLAGVIITAGTLAIIACFFWFFFHDEGPNNRLRNRGGD